MTGPEVISAYHALWQVETSFRMAKTDLRARPVFHHLRDSIEAHLTIVFAALAISRDLHERTGVTTSRLVKTLRPIRAATVNINGHHIVLDPEIPAEAQAVLDKLTAGGH